MERHIKCVLFLAASLLFLIPAAAPGSSRKLVIGSKGFTEQKLLGQMMIAVLENNGFQCGDKTGMGGTWPVRKALAEGKIDIYMEYTGTALSVFLNIREPVSDPVKCYEIVKKQDMERNNLVWLAPMDFNNTYCLMMQHDESERFGIRTLSDLSKYLNRYPDKMIFGLNASFYTRLDGYPSIQHVYKLKFPQSGIIKMDVGLLYKALGEGLLQVALGYSTDGRIKSYNLSVLEDDKHFFPPYNPAPVIRKETAEKYPKLADILEPLSKKLNTEAIIELNYKVDEERIPIRDVVRNWLKSEGL
ncbi:MAG: glycine/betaine ABC transporter substrate-binding protein [Desulfobacteraceae bacterium]|nr:glycine/betaine ABC transporter substrate-binding protein [Desulfobacteraceae bacterium]